ncbi:Tryptophan--tRNA ligase, mitochondrial [Linnemannia exigua]|uniref:Tryptophan--tRNA ligase, mitochondrial n=1 Tax=Linnemannia exigua TaxID=604196 RepID=A0AAD4DAR8_9FUNG|nr:Tryptophan--tRNA ligase, mitochondrial [Linnemannia exigua]
MNPTGRTLLATIRAHPLRTCQSFGARYLTTQPPTTKPTTTPKKPSSTSKPKEKPIIFSGIQPTGQPHLGNYLGAISNWVNLQEQAHLNQETLLFSIVDLHAITMPQDPKKLREERRNMAITLLACGIDPKKVILFEQSKVPGHSELAWILNCLTPVGWLARMTQWKSKLGVTKGAQSLEDVSATQGLQLGLFAYPVLMAADILLYRATKIPVGEDQIQHLELARDIGTTFNKTVKERYFPLPRPIITETKRVMSLRDPTTKMSKSDPSDQTRINLIDSPSLIASKIKRAVTDTTLGISYNRTERPAVANLVDIYAAMKQVSIEEVVEEHRDSSMAVFKEALTSVIVEKLGPIQEEMRRLDGEKGYVERVLEEGAERAGEIARPNLLQAQKLMGLR